MTAYIIIAPLLLFAVWFWMAMRSIRSLNKYRKDSGDHTYSPVNVFKTVLQKPKGGPELDAYNKYVNSSVKNVRIWFLALVVFAAVSIFMGMMFSKKYVPETNEHQETKKIPASGNSF